LRALPGISGMKTFLKVLLFVLLGLLAIKLLPFVLLPVFVVGIGLLLAGGLAFSGIAAAAGIGVAVLVAVVALLVVLVAVLSPIWIPVLAVVGLIALIRRSSRAVA
jgi:hypothetical protein